MGFKKYRIIIMKLPVQKSPEMSSPEKQTNIAALPKRTNVPGWVILLLLLFTALLYTQAIFNGFTAFDDEGYIVNNPYIRDFSWNGIKAIFTSFYSSNLLLYRFWGLSPMPYHILNVLLHIVNTWLVFKVVEKFSGQRITTVIVALFFAIHPLHVESVAWLSELKDVLYSAFYLAALYTYVMYMDTHIRSYYFATLLLFVCSLLSKSAAVTFPVLMIVIDLYRSRKLNLQSYIEKIPFFLLAILFGVLAIFSQKAGEAITNLASDYGYFNRIFLFTSTLGFYFIKLVAPFHLSAMHYYPILIGDRLPWLNYLSLPFIVLVVYAGWRLVRKNPAARREVLFGFGFFLVTISVMLQIISVGGTFASERYAYIPYTGLFYIVGQWIADNVENSQFRQRAMVAMSIYVVVFSVQVWARIRIWKNTEVLFSDIIEKNERSANPGIFVMHNIRGIHRKNAGDPDGAVADFNEALGLLNTVLGTSTGKIDKSEARDYIIRAHIYDELGRYKDAIPDYDKYLSLVPPTATIYNDRGRAYFQLGDKQAALQDFTQAITLDPKYGEAYNNRGWLYAGLGDTKAAMIEYDKAIKYIPTFDKPYFNRGMLKAYIGDFGGSVSDFIIFRRMHPHDNSVYYYLGLAYFNLKDTTTACANWHKAIELGNIQAKEEVRQFCR